MRWITATSLAFVVLVSLFHIDISYTPNPTSRALLAISVVENGTYNIDRFKDWTQDKAFVNNHYYSDKAPLSSWLVIPVYFTFSKLFGLHSDKFPTDWVLLFGVLICGIIPFLFIFLILRAKAIQELGLFWGTLIAFSCCLSSPLLLYAGTYFGHLLAALLLLLGWKSFFEQNNYKKAGLFWGLAFLSEYPTGYFIAAAFFIFALHFLRNQHEVIKNQIKPFLIGLIPSIILAVTHNMLTTGNPFTFAYAFVDDPSFAHMKSQYGFRLPTLDALWGLTFSPYRGLFFYAPAAIFLGIALLWKRSLKSIASNPKTIFILGFFFLICSYKMWNGGWAYGPRHLIPLFVLLAYEGVVKVKTLPAAFKGTLCLFSFFGFLLVFLAKSTTLYMIPEVHTNPLTQLLLPNFESGQLNKNNLFTWMSGMLPFRGHYWWFIFSTFGMLYLAFDSYSTQKENQSGN